MELTLKRMIVRYRWLWGTAFIIMVFSLYSYYFLSACGTSDYKNEPAAKTIVKGWRKMSGNKKGKVIYAQPPKLVILDLNTGKKKAVPGVVVGGAIRRINRGKAPRPSWSPDGKRFLYRYQGSVFVCDEQGNKKEIRNTSMDVSDESRWSWRVEKGEDWAIGPSQKRNVIMVKISDPAEFKTLYGGGDVVSHCEMTGTGQHVVYARREDVFVVPVGSMSVKESLKISYGDPDQGCRPCAAPDDRVAWLMIPHKAYIIHDARSGKEIGKLPAPPGEDIYRLNWSNDPDFAVHMYGSGKEGNQRIHVRRVSTGEYFFIGNGWDPDLWIAPGGK